jgi:hypothetical protein
LDTFSDLRSDQHDLRELVDTYAYACDARDERLFMDLFLPEATLIVLQRGEVELRCEGQQELSKAIRPLAQYKSTMHLMANHRCEVDGDKASGETYCHAGHLREASGSLENLAMTIVYDDDYVRTAAGWKFSARQVRVLWTEVRPASNDRLSL